MNSHNKLELLQNELKEYIKRLESSNYPIKSRHVATSLNTILDKVGTDK